MAITLCTHIIRTKKTWKNDVKTPKTNETPQKLVCWWSKKKSNESLVCFSLFSTFTQKLFYFVANFIEFRVSLITLSLLLETGKSLCKNTMIFWAQIRYFSQISTILLPDFAHWLWQFDTHKCSFLSFFCSTFKTKYFMKNAVHHHWVKLQKRCHHLQFISNKTNENEFNWKS